MPDRMAYTVTFWGTRGSIPTPGPHTVRYGGNTPCVAVEGAGGHLVILDAGTVLVELDHRRRTGLGKIGRKEHTRYLVEEKADGTLIWRPAVVVPEHELRFMRAHPEEYAEIRRNQASPDPERRRERPRRATGAARV